MNIEDIGIETFVAPIKRVRLQFHNGHWYVEYQRKAQFLIDGFWWFDDGKYANYLDAKKRVEEIVADGGIKTHRQITIEHAMKDIE